MITIILKIVIHRQPLGRFHYPSLCALVQLVRHNPYPQIAYFEHKGDKMLPKIHPMLSGIKKTMKDRNKDIGISKLLKRTGKIPGVHKTYCGPWITDKIQIQKCKLRWLQKSSEYC